MQSNIKNFSSVFLVMLALVLIGPAYFNGIILLVSGQENRATIISESYSKPVQTVIFSADGRQIITKRGRVFNSKPGTVATVMETDKLAYNGSRLKLLTWILMVPIGILSYVIMSRGKGESNQNNVLGNLAFIALILSIGYFFFYL